MSFLQTVQTHVTATPPYIAQHWSEMFPNWSKPPLSTLITLQQARCSLSESDAETDQEKYRLWNEYYTWGQQLRQQMLAHSPPIPCAIISPKNGKPLFSPPGDRAIDLVMVVHQSLGMPFYRTPQGCKCLLHPQWKTAVYPGLIVFSRTKQEITAVLKVSNWLTDQTFRPPAK